MSLDFAALDVETANSNRGSICSIGVAIVRGGAVVESREFLTRPPRELDWFDGFNISIHGIRPEDVATAPSYAAQLEEVCRLVDGLPVIAHNAAFDIGALRDACDADGLDWPTLTYGCSLVMARRAGLGLLSYRLPFICDAMGLPMGEHHRADEDAEAACRIVLALAERMACDSLDELADRLMVRLGRLTRSEWAGCVKTFADAMRNRPEANADADPDHPLYGKSLAFTGGLSILRAQAFALVAELGATPQAAPTKATDFLVIGDGFTGHSAADFHTGKALKAAKINSKGGCIEVLTEGDLLDLLSERHTSGVRRPLPEPA